MKKRTAWITAMVLALALSLTGCAGGNLNGAETIATLDGSTNITLGEFNLMLRYQQAQMESYYGALMGGNMYQQDITGDGTLYGDTAKETLMEEFKKMYIMEAEASNYGVALTDAEKEAVAAAAGKFLEANTDGAQKAATADQKTVERLLTLLTINEKMYDALTQDVDTEVSDAEAAQKRIDYVYVSTLGTEQDEAGNTIELTDAEKAQKKADLQAVLDEAKKSGDLDAAAQAKEMTASSTAYGADSTYPSEEVRKAADALKEGEFADIVETENGYYLIRLASMLDRDATDSRKTSIVQERRDELFAEKYRKLQEAHTFEKKDDVMAKLTFERTFTLKAAETAEP